MSQKPYKYISVNNHFLIVNLVDFIKSLNLTISDEVNTLLLDLSNLRKGIDVFSPDKESRDILFKNINNLQDKIIEKLEGSNYPPLDKRTFQSIISKVRNIFEKPTRTEEDRVMVDSTRQEAIKNIEDVRKLQENNAKRQIDYTNEYREKQRPLEDIMEEERRNQESSAKKDGGKRRSTKRRRSNKNRRRRNTRSK